jgi:D-alanine transaminase
MSSDRILTWVNGEIHDPADAKISIFDRGFLFGDSVYELTRFFDGEGVGFELHVERLERSMSETGITGFNASDYRSISSDLMQALEIRDACIYIQVTRGVQMPRRHLPEPDLRPTVIAIATPSAPLSECTEPQKVPVVIMPDQRRDRCDIKATSLLDNVMMSMLAHEQDAEEPILHRDGMLTEGATSNVFVVRDGRLLTPELRDPRPILEGVTRRLVREAAAGLGLPVSEESISVEAFRSAEEAFVSSSRRLVGAITSIDGVPVAGARPGAVTMELFNELRRRIGAREGSARIH